MKYRALDADGDFSFGGKGLGFLADTPATVAQALTTRLKLFKGEWFPDPSVGVDYMNRVLGTGTAGLYDREIQTVILGTPGVLEIQSYTSYSDAKRGIHIECTVTTRYGVTTVTTGV